MHIPVLLNEAVDGLDLKTGDVFVDCTLGSGGHSKEVCRRYGQNVKILAIDADQNAIDRSKSIISVSSCDIAFENDNFRNITEILKRHSLFGKVAGILLDLGLSSEELEKSGRGFSFQKDEPLLMTFSDKLDPDTLTAMDIVNKYSAEELDDIFREYGEERFSRKMSEAIIEERSRKLITTTDQLVNALSRAVPRKFRSGRIHFATKVFQAIRMEVNDELGALSQVLESGFESLKEGGRMAVISFHSLEDRKVKTFFKKLAESGKGSAVTKKPIRPAKNEIQSNPRSRSAKLRIIEKLK